MEQKPNVLPTQSERLAAEERAKIAAYEAEKKVVTNEVYSNSSENHNTAIEMMRRRTEEQLKLKEQYGMVKDESLSERPVYNVSKSEEQLRMRDEQLKKNADQINNYQKQYNEANERNPNKTMENKNYSNIPPNNPPINRVEPYGESPSNINKYVIELSQPNYNSAFDVIPLPSKGKLYYNRKSNIRVSYLTTADENILTSSNLLKSGEFLEILMNRKILEQEIRYKDLHVGDRNAIMIWLRATGYGEKYPVTLLDEFGEPFETEIDLNELKIKELGAEPDSEGLFEFNMKLSRANVKFRFLTCGDIDDIEAIVDREKENGSPIDNSLIYRMQKMIVEVNGNRNKENIAEFVQNIRIKDSSDFLTYVSDIESGIDLNLVVQTPGGGSVETFLPLNVNFFWPNARI